MFVVLFQLIMQIKDVDQIGFFLGLFVWIEWKQSEKTEV